MYKFFFIALILISSLFASKDIAPCSSISSTITECDPYQTNFLISSRVAVKDINTIRNKPITKRLFASGIKEKIENNRILNVLINKYIDKQEDLYSKRQKKSLYAADEVQEPEENYITFEIKPSKTEQNNTERNKTEPGKKENTDFTVAIENKTDLNITQNQKLEKKQEASTKKPKFATYTVVKGDYFAKIARKFKVAKDKLIEINNFDKNKILKVGEKIFIPIEDQDYVDAIVNYSYVVKSGDSLIKISRRFGINLEDIKKYNNLKKRSLIRVGEKLILPIGDKLNELKAKEELAKKIALEKKKKALALKKKRERERLAKLALKKKKREEFLRISKGMKHSLSVIATAYSSTHSQTDSTPFLAAWNNRIRPGMKIIAVSWDLIHKYGITNGTKVRISGLPGIYTVRDKMNKKWRRRIDIYMGVDHRRTNRWGKRRVTLYY